MSMKLSCVVGQRAAGRVSAMDMPMSTMGYQVRQVFDLPEPKPLEVTEHHAHGKVTGVRLVGWGEHVLKGDQ